jgi:hypothetical protein
METAGPSAPARPIAAARQKVADERLLRQQEVESAQAARVTDQQVKAAQVQKDATQREVRIQDAPGPAQTLPAPRSMTPSELPKPPQVPQVPQG